MSGRCLFRSPRYANSDFLSNHWLEHRLPLEPEWAEQTEAAGVVLERPPFSVGRGEKTELTAMAMRLA